MAAAAIMVLVLVVLLVTYLLTGTVYEGKSKRVVAFKYSSNMENGVALCRKTSSLEEGPDSGPLYRWMTIETLPDDVLLEIFTFYVDEADRFYVNEPDKFHVDKVDSKDEWHTLVHVCRRWRNLVLASPRRLHLTLLCTLKKPVRKMLDVWPVLPIVILSFESDSELLMERADNIFAAVEQSDRVCQITLVDMPSSQLERIAAVMQEPFPALTSMYIGMWDADEWAPVFRAPVFPDSFLGGSAPRLRHLDLMGVSFSGLERELRLSASDLVDLHVWDVPHSGYISPEALTAFLAAMTRLKSLHFGFRSRRSHPDQANRLSSRLPRIVLPALTKLRFKGFSEYFEDLLSRIDIPLLGHVNVTFFDQPTFHTSQFLQFLRRTEQLKVFDEGELVFGSRSVGVSLSSQKSKVDHNSLTLRVSCPKSDQLSSLVLVCSSCSPLLSTLRCLNIQELGHPGKQTDIDNTSWLELLHLFTAVKDLHVSEEVVPHVAAALQELVGERVTAVLPALQNLFIPKQWLVTRFLRPVPAGAFEQFAAARQLSGHPVAVLPDENGT
ncbi:hypothetical protein BJV74DRAFT_916747 [Russula compacta]|nr:hypothetical protein BJV74DRAFT_916747 [Russula compacta]